MAEDTNQTISTPSSESTPKSYKRQLTGVVVSTKGDKTIVVRVERTKEHPLYRKRYKVHKNYKAHDPKNEYQPGDQVIIEEGRPLSKDKNWLVLKKV